MLCIFGPQIYCIGKQWATLRLKDTFAFPEHPACMVGLVVTSCYLLRVNITASVGSIPNNLTTSCCWITCALLETLLFCLWRVSIYTTYFLYTSILIVTIRLDAKSFFLYAGRRIGFYCCYVQPSWEQTQVIQINIHQQHHMADTVGIPPFGNIDFSFVGTCFIKQPYPEVVPGKPIDSGMSTPFYI